MLRSLNPRPLTFPSLGKESIRANIVTRSEFMNNPYKEVLAYFHRMHSLH